MEISRIDPEALGKTPWLTTEVRREDRPDVNVKDDYLGVVGLSLWDTGNNRYEFFDTETGASKLAHGGGGYYFVTGNKRHHILVPEGGGVVKRRLEVLDDAEFAYTRVVPERLIEGNPLVTIRVVHRPYRGALKIRFTARP